MAAVLGQANLAVLALDHCAGITDVSGIAFLVAVEANPAILTLGLKGTGVSRECRAKVEAALAKNAAKQRTTATKRKAAS